MMAPVSVLCDTGMRTGKEDEIQVIIIKKFDIARNAKQLTDLSTPCYLRAWILLKRSPYIVDIWHTKNIQLSCIERLLINFSPQMVQQCACRQTKFLPLNNFVCDYWCTQ